MLVASSYLLWLCSFRKQIYLRFLCRNNINTCESESGSSLPFAFCFINLKKHFKTGEKNIVQY